MAYRAAVCREIEELNIGDLMVSDGIDLEYAGDPALSAQAKSPVDFIERAPYVERWWVSLARSLGITDYAVNSKTPWVIRIRFDLEKLLTYKIKPCEISAVVMANAPSEQFSCIGSPLALAEIEIALDCTVVQEKLNSQGIVNKTNFSFYIARDIVPYFIRTIPLQGIPGVVKAISTELTGRDGKKEWVVETQGDNALSTLLGMEGVDNTRTISNNVREVFQVLGIEPARRFLIEEITRVLSFDGGYVNDHHIPVLVDVICQYGTLTSVRRDGIDRHEVGPIAKAAFEMTIENILKSAAFSETDNLEGFSAQIMFGQTTKCGTGSVSIGS